MLFLALILTTTSAPPEQVLAGPVFEQFAEKTDRLCPARRLRLVTPGDLSWEQEGFEEWISPTLEKRLTAANRQNDRCAHRNGLSCPTVETLAAMERTNILPAFASFACAYPQPGAAR